MTELAIEGNAGAVSTLRHVFIRLLDTCNLECAHCYASCGPRAKPSLAITDVLRVVGEVADLGAETVHLEGGEALIYPHIWEVIDALNAAGVRPSITSNGLSTRRALLERLAGRVARMTFSVDGPTAVVHDRIRRRIGSFDRVCAAIEDSVSLGIPTSMISVIWKESAHRVGEIVALAERLSVDRLLLFSCGRIGAAIENWEELACSDDLWFEYLRAVRELARSRPWLWFELDRVPRDELDLYLPTDYKPYCLRFPRDSIIIDPKGDVYPCGYFIPSGRSLGNIADASLSELLARPKNGERLSGACVDPWSLNRGNVVPLCKLFSINAETLARLSARRDERETRGSDAGR